MAHLLLRRKSNIKPVPIVKTPSNDVGVQFRWSISAAQLTLLKQTSSSKFHLINLDESQQKSFFSSPFSTESRRSFSTPKLSPRLPSINNLNQKDDTSSSTKQNNNTQTSPLSLTFSQLHRAQHRPGQTKKKSRIRFSIYPDKQSEISSSSQSTSSSTNDKYVRLQTPQLRRLHVSEKYMNEAKTLYFNPASKVFVPRHAITPVS